MNFLNRICNPQAKKMDYLWFIERFGLNEYLDFYQADCRIYLDEYEVEEWNYLPLFDNTIIMNRFLDKK